MKTSKDILQVNHSNGCCCNCAASSYHCNVHSINRRKFLYSFGVTAAATALSYKLGESVIYADDNERQMLGIKKELVVQPVLTYDLPQRRDATSWRSWGGIQTEEQAKAEQQRINEELQKLSKQANFKIKFLPVEPVRSVEKAQNLVKGDFDVLLLYAAGGWVNLLEALTSTEKWNVMFLRHDPGPVYLWYEIVHNRFFRKTVDEITQVGWSVEDVVIDNTSELLWRFRALYGLKNAMNKKILCVGGASGWGQGGADAPSKAKEIWKMQLIDYPYKELSKKLESAYRDSNLVKKYTDEAGRYLRQSGIKLRTDRGFVNRAFVLDAVFRDLMAQEKTDAMTINACMGTIMTVSKTTACLPLSLINDDDGLAFCESDFVVIPSGVLLHYISGLPVFLNDPTYPHDDMITLAHCTAPRKMDGKHYEPTLVLTHFESDYGAAPKVEMRIGQRCTCLRPDFGGRRWVGLSGKIVKNPFLDICRSQIDVKIDGDQSELMKKMHGFHWMVCYNDYMKEVQYALQKIGVGFLNLSSMQKA